MNWLSLGLPLLDVSTCLIGLSSCEKLMRCRHEIDHHFSGALTAEMLTQPIRRLRSIISSHYMPYIEFKV